MIDQRFIKDLVLLTIRQPAEAAGVLQDLKLPSALVWNVLVLGVCLSALALSLRITLFPVEVLQSMPLQELLSPFGIFATLIIRVGLLTVVLTATGRWLGGQGRFIDTLVFIAWLQVLRAMIESAGLVLSLVSPGVAALGVTLAGLYGIWILLNFQNVTQGYGSLARAAGSLVLSLFAIAFVMAVFISPFVSMNSAG